MNAQQTSATRLDEAALLDIVSKSPGFSPPSQARSRETTYAMIVSAHALLRDRPYERIKMQEVAARAGCSVSAIYARFVDKNALLTAVHLLALEECRPMLEESISVEKLSDKGLRGVARAFAKINEYFFGQNFNMVVASLTVNSDSAYRVTAHIMDPYALRLASVAATLMGLTVDEILDSVKLAIHTCLGIYRDSVLAIEYFKPPSIGLIEHVFVSIVEGRIVN